MVEEAAKGRLRDARKVLADGPTMTLYESANGLEIVYKKTVDEKICGSWPCGLPWKHEGPHNVAEKWRKPKMERIECNHTWAVTPSHKWSTWEKTEAFWADEKFVQLQCTKCKECRAARNELPITGPLDN